MAFGLGQRLDLSAGQIPPQYIVGRIPADGSEILGIMRRIEDILGAPVYLVGGAVRDLLMGRPVNDIDVVVVGKPVEEIAERLRSHGIVVNPAGEAFGVLRAYLDGRIVDIAVPRREAYSSRSRKPAVEYTSLIEDLQRRDFTINAMAMDAEGNIIDPFGGLEDLRARRLRFVGDPDQRIAEDPLRMLRAARFAAKGFAPTPETIEAVRRNASELLKVSRERIRDELCKGLESKGAYLRWLHEMKLLEVILPPAKLWAAVRHDYRGHHHGESILEHTMEVLDRLDSADCISALAALLHDVMKPYVVEAKNGKISFHGHAEASAEYAEKWLRWMRFENNVIRQVVPVIRLHMALHEAVAMRNPKLLARVWIELGEDPKLASLLLRLAEADTGMRYDWAREQFAKFASIPRLITGRDAVELGIPEPKRAAWLKKVREIQLVRGITNRDELLKIARGVVV